MSNLSIYNVTVSKVRHANTQLRRLSNLLRQNFDLFERVRAKSRVESTVLDDLSKGFRDFKSVISFESIDFQDAVGIYDTLGEESTIRVQAMTRFGETYKLTIPKSMLSSIQSDATGFARRAVAWANLKSAEKASNEATEDAIQGKIAKLEAEIASLRETSSLEVARMENREKAARKHFESLVLK